MSNLPPWLATSSEELNQRMLRGLKEEIPLIKVSRLYLVSGNLIQVFGSNTFRINIQTSWCVWNFGTSLLDD